MDYKKYYAFFGGEGLDLLFNIQYPQKGCKIINASLICFSFLHYISFCMRFFKTYHFSSNGTYTNSSNEAQAQAYITGCLYNPQITNTLFFLYVLESVRLHCTMIFKVTVKYQPTNIKNKHKWIVLC